MSLLASAADNTAGRPAPPAASPEIFGRTVAEARTLLKRAKEVIIHYPTSTENGLYTETVFLSKRAFASALKYKPAGDDMPCQLRMINTTMMLVIGGYGSRLAARDADAKEARDAAASR
jgi:hypothetical protein